MSGSSHGKPVRPQHEINTLESEYRARAAAAAIAAAAEQQAQSAGLEKKRGDLEKVIMEDVEYRGLVCGPDDEGEDTEEPLERKIALDVKTPKRSEIDEHEKTHLPFRSWCKICVKGSGVANAHARIQDDPTSPQVVLDYFFSMCRHYNIRSEARIVWSYSIGTGTEEGWQYIMDCETPKESNRL